jgi:hypothetical protein
MKIRLLPEAERDLEIGADEIYAVLDARQDPLTINAVLDSPRNL